jgi:hypothetical protein
MAEVVNGKTRRAVVRKRWRAPFRASAWARRALVFRRRRDDGRVGFGADGKARFDAAALAF